MNLYTYISPSGTTTQLKWDKLSICLVCAGTSLSLYCYSSACLSTHQSRVILVLSIMLIVMLFNNAGKAAGIGGGAGKVLSLGDGWSPATHCKTAHLGHSDHNKMHWKGLSCIILISLSPLAKTTVLLVAAFPQHWIYPNISKYFLVYFRSTPSCRIQSITFTI